MKARLLCWALLLAGCGSESRIVEFNGARDASLFLVHLDDSARPKGTEGPFRIDSEGLIEGGPVVRTTGYFETTEPLIISHPALEEYTSRLDPTAKGRRRFRRNSRCWMDEACDIELSLLSSDQEIGSEELAPGSSIGALRGFIPSSVVVSEDAAPDWLAQLALVVPYDLERIETERLRPFGAVEDWAVLQNLGLQDFLPVSDTQVLVISTNEICLVSEEMRSDEICATDTQRIAITDFPGTARSSRFDRIAGHPNVGRIYALAKGRTSHLLSFEISDNRLTNIQTETATSSRFRELALTDDGTVMAVAVRNSEEPEGTLHGLELSPDGTQKWHLIRQNKDSLFTEEVENVRVTASNDPEHPFATGTQSAMQVRDTTTDQWLNTDFEVPGPDAPDLYVRSIAALRDNDDFAVWTAHDEGILLRFASSESMVPRRVELGTPSEYGENCQFETMDFNLVTDIQDLHVRGPHDAFLVAKRCAVLLWFDPNPIDRDDRLLSLFIDEGIARPWATINGDVGQLRIRALGDYVWVGSGASLSRVRQPPLRSTL